MEAASATEITIPIDEWDMARHMAHLIRADERSPMGHVRVRSDGQRRRWYAADPVLGIIRDGAPCADHFDVGIPPAALAFVDVAASLGGEVLLCVNHEEERIGIVGSGGELWLHDPGHQFPNVDKFIPSSEMVAASATVSARSLYHLLESARVQRTHPDEGEYEGPRPCWVSISEGVFRIEVVWPGVGTSIYQLPAFDVTGDVGVEVNPVLLSKLLEQFHPTDDCYIGIPRYAADPVLLRGEGTTAVLMPIPSYAALALERVENAIREAFGPLALVRDDDGDYPLVRRQFPLYARFTADGLTPLCQVFAVVLSGIENSPEVWRELNDLNASVGLARVFQIDDQVLAEVDLVADIIDADALQVAAARIHGLATEIAPTIAAVYGGQLIEDPAEARLVAYRSTIVEAELRPGSLEPLNGIAAVAEWPFPGPVHVLTGWNPQGAAFDPASNTSTNIAIAEEVLRHGGRFVHGHGRLVAGDHVEASIVAWGLSREQARAMGQQALQDAIFEIDEATMHLVSCVDDRVDSWPRCE
ncbi:MAG: DUF3293 domain-containing protein [Acidimicrobiia bacterium]|nr:DUF3293 domain-containing protein [Acidimicrobiia bacterium]